MNNLITLREDKPILKEHDLALCVSDTFVES